MEVGGEDVGWLGVGAVSGEIPAASAGMTELWARVWRKRGVRMTEGVGVIVIGRCWGDCGL